MVINIVSSLYCMSSWFAGVQQPERGECQSGEPRWNRAGLLQ